MVKVARNGFGMEVSPVFVRNLQSKKRIVVNQGGTRSGKTYSILQRIYVYCKKNRGKIIDVVRKTKAELADTALVDFIQILTDLGVYNDKMHNKTKDHFTINGNLVRFMGLDKAQKKRGSKRDLLYINEANGITLEDWVQLTMRVSEQIYLDFNPSEEFWLHEQVLDKRNDYDFIKSTYLDNYDYLPEAQIKEIENLINVDEYYYQVYVLGNLAKIKGTIYEKFNIITPEEYDVIDYDQIFYGLDFGYEHYTALIEVKYAQEKVYERMIYMETHKKDEDLIRFMEEYGVSYSAEIYADPAYPASLRRLREAGFEDTKKANKKVDDGIRFCRGLDRYVCSSSSKYIKQLKKYKNRQTADGRIIEEPVKIDDDGPDAMRYAEYTHLKVRIGEY